MSVADVLETFAAEYSGLQEITLPKIDEVVPDDAIADGSDTDDEDADESEGAENTDEEKEQDSAEEGANNPDNESDPEHKIIDRECIRKIKAILREHDGLKEKAKDVPSSPLFIFAIAFGIGCILWICCHVAPIAPATCWAAKTQKLIDEVSLNNVDIELLDSVQVDMTCARWATLLDATTNLRKLPGTMYYARNPRAEKVWVSWCHLMKKHTRNGFAFCDLCPYKEYKDQNELCSPLYAGGFMKMIEQQVRSYWVDACKIE